MERDGVGAQIKARRLARGWTQAQLAELMDTTQKTIGSWERTDDIPAHKVARVMSVLAEPQLQDNGLSASGHRTYTMSVALPPRADDTPLGQLARLRRQLSEQVRQLSERVAEVDMIMDLLQLEDQG
jgi:transcriptional regulator with XRE-family HTH domain